MTVLILIALSGCGADDETECKDGEYRTIFGTCAEISEDGGDDAGWWDAGAGDAGWGDDTGWSDDGGEPYTTVSVTWGAGALVLEIDHGSGAYYFGVAETDPAGASDAWTGEDCYLGYTLSNGDLLSYCHPAADGTNAFAYGGDPLALREATETVFPDSSYEPAVTYYLESGADCWVWGEDTSYYSALGCTDIE